MPAGAAFPPTGPARRGRGGLGVAAAALLFAAAWALLHPAVPPEPSADLYDSLSVSRHLLRGDGFLCDVAYPLSFAFPFAARLPQPLVHRPPGQALLLLPAVAAAGGDPGRALAAARGLYLLLLVLLAAAGLAAARRDGAGGAVAPWLLLLLFNPLLAMTASCVQSEVPAALLLALLWWRWRWRPAAAAARPEAVQAPAPADPARPSAAPRSPARAAAADGALAAALTLLRPELAWVPLLWAAAGRRRWTRRAALTAGAVWLLLLAPWAARNAAVAGSPFFSLQVYAEHLKETPAHPGYDVYRSLSPEPFWSTLAREPGVVAAKTAAGLRYFAARAGRWLPWPLWAAAAWLLLGSAWRARRGSGPGAGDPGAGSPEAGGPGGGDDGPARPGGSGRAPGASGRPAGDLALAVATLALLTVQYAALSHTVRHLFVLLPLLLLEIWRSLARGLAAARPGWPAWRRTALLLAAAAACQLLAPARMPGWDAARERAAAGHAAVLGAVARTAALPAGPVFTDSAAYLWWTGRAGVALPASADVEARLRALAPELAAAPVVRALTGP